MTIQIKRIYDPHTPSDGYRILIDRLWPRGIRKEDAHIDLWLKEIAPDNELRKWFDHDPAKWKTFQEKYRAAIHKNPALAQLKEVIHQHKTITLLYSAKDIEHNNALVLKNYLTTP